jgi:hypothetical protein
LLVSSGDRVVDRLPAEHPRESPLSSACSFRHFATLAAAALSAVAGLTTSAARADEVCRYTGTTSHSGHVLIESKAAAAANGETTVDITARVNARSFGLIDWQYLYQEIGTFRDRELQSVAVNHRYKVFGSIRRQQWDLFVRGKDGMSAYRVQGKSLSDFQKKHPGFVRHWDLSSFGVPWRADYASAPPDRRADLDLPKAAMPPGLGTSLLMAFYWVRWAGRETRTVPLFLPGFKKNARIDVQVVAPGSDANGWLQLHTAVFHPQLSRTEVSTGDAWIAPDHRLMRVVFNAHGDLGSASGEFRLDGCQGEPPKS